MSENVKASNIIEDIVSRHARRTSLTIILALVVTLLCTTYALYAIMPVQPQIAAPSVEQANRKMEDQQLDVYDTKQKLIGYINAVMIKPLADDPVAMDYAFGLLHHRPSEAWGLSNANRIELDIEDLQDAELLLNSFRYYSIELSSESSEARWKDEAILASLAKEVEAGKDKMKLISQASSYLDLWISYYQAIPSTDDKRDAKNLYAQRVQEKILSRLDSGRM